MKYKITAKTRTYNKADFTDYKFGDVADSYTNFAELEDGECDTKEEAENKLFKYRSSILVNNDFVFVTEYILDSGVHWHVPAPLSENSCEVLRSLQAGKSYKE